MYLLYLDGSGSVRNPKERYFVLAGIAVFERQIYHLISKADQFVASLNVGNVHEVELHGSVIANNKAHPWKGIGRKERLAIIERALTEMLGRSHKSVIAFAVAVEKSATPGNDSVEYAFEEICNRFDLFLKRQWKKEEKQHRGLVVMDHSQYEGTLQRLARSFRDKGTRWGELKNLSEVPLFVDSTASRLIQIADLLAWAVWRRYEYSDSRYFDKIVGKFDKEGGVMHGLVHRKPLSEECHCPSCLTRFFSTHYQTSQS